MERAKPVRKSHTDTSDLLTWSEAPPPTSPAAASPSVRSHQPSDGIRKVVFGGQVTEEESQSLMKRKPCSGYKTKEMSGNGIFAANGSDATPESGSADSRKSSVRMVQQATKGISQISFTTKESAPPKKPTSVAEVAKQRELSGTLKTESDLKAKKQQSNAKSKELSGHNIFAPPSEIPPRPLPTARSIEAINSKHVDQPAPRSVRTSVKVSNPAGGQSKVLFGEESETRTTRKIHNQKVQELTGNNIFKGVAPVESPEKPLSQAKLREMSGSNVFANGGGKAQPRDYFGGVRKPPGGESSIALI